MLTLIYINEKLGLEKINNLIFYQNILAKLFLNKWKIMFLLHRLFATRQIKSRPRHRATSILLNSFSPTLPTVGRPAYLIWMVCIGYSLTMCGIVVDSAPQSYG